MKGGIESGIKIFSDYERRKYQKVFLPENRRKALIHIEFRGMDSFRIIIG